MKNYTDFPFLASKTLPLFFSGAFAPTLYSVDAPLHSAMQLYALWIN